MLFRSKMRDLVYYALKQEGLTYEHKDVLQTTVAVDPVALESMRKILPKDPYAVLVPGSAWLGKEWPYYVSLAEEIGKKMPVIVLGGTNDMSCESVTTAAVKTNSQSLGLQGKTSLAESIAVIAGAKLVIGNDTGLIQVSEALDKTTIMIEGPTEASMGFSLYKKSSKSIGLDLFCRPCSKTGKFCWRMGQRTCMKGLSATQVMNDVRTFL